MKEKMEKNWTKFLQRFQRELSNLGYLDGLEMVAEGIWVASCERNDTLWWNNAVAVGWMGEDLQAVEKYFAARKRKATFYFSEEEENKELERKLRENGYEQSDYEVWLEIEGKSWDRNDGATKRMMGKIKKVELAPELEIFIETIDRGFGANDPDNPYGGLGEYLGQIRKSYDLIGGDGVIEYYVIYEGEEGAKQSAVGVGCLTSYGGVGYISNLATLPEVRGQGFGRELVKYLVKLSAEKGNKMHCLATEVGSKAESFYRHLGFEEMFRAKYYTKEGQND